MKKNISILFSVILFSLIFPSFVFAASVGLEYFTNQTNSTTGKVELRLKVNTTGIPDGKTVSVNIYKTSDNTTKIGPTVNVTITNNYGEYRSDYILDSGVTYTVVGVSITPDGAATGSIIITTGASDPVVLIGPGNITSNPVTITGQNTTTTNSTTYNLLAPIGTFTKAPDNVGDYFNLIFKIAIGLCGALAVVMIVIGGVQYMGDESIFGKTEAKSRITSAILGLLIALGSWAILNTINPDLLGGGGVHIDQVTATITPLYDRGNTDPKKANGESIRCTPVLSGPCSVASLTSIFGADNAIAMSKICNMESGGTNASSGTDICKPGNNTFSFGLFQVNLAANGILAGTDCANLFDKKVAAKDVIEPRYTSGYNCSLLSGKETLYNTCKNILLDPNKNLAIAKSLFTANKSAWVGDKKYCASAFN